MMLVAKSSFLVLILAAIGDCSEPTQSPSAAPTSAPTSQDAETDQETSTSSTTSSSSSSTVASTTRATINTTGKAVTTFTTKLSLADATDFSEEHYLASIVTLAGVSAENVQVTSVKFVVAASYKFSESVSRNDVIDAVAANGGTAHSAVTATISAARRLAVDRRLSVLADVKLETDSATKANDLKRAANNAEALANELTRVTARTISIPEITATPDLVVFVATQVVSADDTAIAAPAAEDISSELTERTGKVITAEVMDVVMTGTVPTTTGSRNAGESSGALSQKTMLDMRLFLAVGFAIWFCGHVWPSA